MQELRKKIENMVDEYNLRFAPSGIKILLSKKYFETAVRERSTYHPDSGIHLLNRIEALFNRHNERKYKNTPNNYHCIVLTVSPQDEDALPKELCKSYSFVVKKTERHHIGAKPNDTSYDNSKILKKIEKKLDRIAKKAQKKDAVGICKDTMADAIRYGCSTKYTYKKRILGKDRYYWEIFNLILFSILAVVMIAGLYFASIII